MDSRTVSDYSRNTLADRLHGTQKLTKSHARLKGGFTISKITKAKTENESFTCPNPKCAKDFTNPITVQDLSSKNEASYSACPHCLTKIETQAIESARIRQTIAQFKEIEATKQPPTIHKCPHKFGYLRTRSKSENISEECMTCEKLLDCMLVGSK
jgi:hypothetical protein